MKINRKKYRIMYVLSKKEKDARKDARLSKGCPQSEGAIHGSDQGERPQF